MSNTSRLIHSQKGFSLVELLMVLIISSLFVTMVVVFYTQYNAQKRISKTDDHMSESILQVSMSFPSTLSYPCPADRALTPDDDGYLEEFHGNCDVRGLVLDSGCTVSAAGGLTTGVYNVNTCNGCTDDGGLCVVPGARDMNDDGVIGNDHREIVVIGGIPARSMRELSGSSFSDDIAEDGYGSLLTYAVSRSLAHDGQYVYYQGVISAIDEGGRPTAGIENDGHYVIVSHGTNRQGAFSPLGSQVIECGLLGRDTENCDGDSTFMQAILRNEGTALEYYDDKMTVSRSTSLKLWTNIGNTSSVRNLNKNNLAINLPAPDGVSNVPSQLVHVAGDVRTDGTIRAQDICLNPPGSDPDDTGDDICFDPGTFISEHECSGANQLVTRIDLSQGTTDAQLGCTEVEFAAVQNRSCGTGWVNAIRVDGSVDCLPNPSPTPPPSTYVPIGDPVKPGGFTMGGDVYTDYTGTSVSLPDFTAIDF